MIEMCIPSSLDPTLAPKGSHVALLFTQYTPYNLGHDKDDGNRRRQGWSDEEKAEYADVGEKK